ncbi:MAG TPA: flagellar protein FlaG [Bryobacteraceae bacterium]|jgi:uncharacterized FlaG/YvyC family protein|nr:flagellar protein FlaG [Bryobacteraceae bacterium]
MNISSSSPSASASILPAAVNVPPEEAAQRRHLVQAAKSVNASGMLGQNQFVFAVDPATHRMIMRVENRDTHEVVLQVPPEYVIRLAEDLGSPASHTLLSQADTLG